MPREPKPRIGRPPGRIYSHRLIVRVKPDELETIQEAAEAEGTTLSEIVRVAVKRHVLELRRRGRL
jgi:uncharacterized protein (DUF1778 family)